MRSRSGRRRGPAALDAEATPGASSTCTATRRGSFDCLSDPGRHRQGGDGARADPPGDHRPRPDRRRARGAGAGAGRADGDRRRGGQDARRRPDLPLPRAGDPARAVGRRDDRRGPRAGRRWSASRIRSTGCAGRSCATRRWRSLVAAGRLGRDPQRAASSAMATSRRRAFAHEHGLPGIAVSDAHSIMEVGVAYTALDGDPSTRPACSRRCRAPRSSRAGRATSSGSGRRSPRASSACAATAGSRPDRPTSRAGRPDRPT